MTFKVVDPVANVVTPRTPISTTVVSEQDATIADQSAAAYRSITAIDLTDPKTPFVVWQGDVQSHGLSLSPDGNRAYLANPDVEFGDMIILDTSQIQARKPNPHTREVSRTTWDRVSIPKNAIPFT